MNELVFKGSEGRALTNSQLVAEKFGKRHADVLRAVEEHISALETTDAKVRWFCQSSYYDAKGEERKMYIMTRDGFSLLTMSFNNTRDVLNWKVSFIEAFNQMEKALKDQQKTLSPAESLLQSVQMLVEQERKMAMLENKVSEIEQRTVTDLKYSTVIAYVTRHKIQLGLTRYPDEILDEVFDAENQLKKDELKN